VSEEPRFDLGRFTWRKHQPGHRERRLVTDLNLHDFSPEKL
jgi:hypothetical protein